jgi:cytochrome c oxidase assembly protein subunit 15
MTSVAPVFNKAIRIWLWICAAFVLTMIVVGGITRLTGSGLSITRWELVTGVLPPLSESAWQEAFDLYKTIPQYQQINQGMSLDAFKQIYFWEWFHRLLGRLTGLVFVLPPLFFWKRGALSPLMLKLSVAMILLVGAQGFMGWFMVKSGLADRNYVSHFRLAAHLVLAFSLLALCIVAVKNLSTRTVFPKPEAATWFRRHLHVFTALLGIQIVWGAFTAGLHAGPYFPTFPAMNGSWLPVGLWDNPSLLANFVWNPKTIHWFHRLLGFALTGYTALLLVRAIRTKHELGDLASKIFALAGVVVVQILIAWVMVVKVIPITWAVLHQCMAAVVLMHSVSALMAAKAE